MNRTPKHPAPPADNPVPDRAANHPHHRPFAVLRRAAACAAVLVALLSTGCVRKDWYDQALGDLARARADKVRLTTQVQGLQREVARLGQEIAARDAQLAEGRTQHADFTKRVDDLMILNAELSERLKGAGHSVEQLATERGNLSKALAETRAQLVELRKQQEAANARAAQLRDLYARFQKLVDAGKLKIVFRGGRMLLELPNDVLFDSGRPDLKVEGRGTVLEVAKVLRTMPDRKFQIAGHTDNVKIQSGRFPSNWELSTARAVEVVKKLIDGGMPPQNLSAAGFGEFTPAESNDTPAGRAKNRRIEIALQPNLDEFVKVPGVAEPPAPPAPGAKPAAATPKAAGPTTPAASPVKPAPATPAAPQPPPPTPAKPPAGKPQDFGERQ
jgi:chemotaxis protein MotB